MTVSEPSAETQPCRYCLEPIKAGAIACPHCARDQIGETAGSVQVADRSARLGIAVIMILLLAQIIVTFAVLA